MACIWQLQLLLLLLADCPVCCGAWAYKQCIAAAAAGLSGPKGRPLLMAAAGSACAGCTVGFDVHQGKCRGSNGPVLRQRVSGACACCCACAEVDPSSVLMPVMLQLRLTQPLLLMLLLRPLGILDVPSSLLLNCYCC
jgi:hypothetical protein